MRPNARAARRHHFGHLVAIPTPALIDAILRNTLLYGLGIAPSKLFLAAFPQVPMLLAAQSPRLRLPSVPSSPRSEKLGRQRRASAARGTILRGPNGPF